MWHRSNDEQPACVSRHLTRRHQTREGRVVSGRAGQVTEKGVELGGGGRKKKDKRQQHVCVSKEVKAGHDIIRLLFHCCCKQCLRFHEAFSTCVVKNIAVERQSVKKTSSNE